MSRKCDCLQLPATHCVPENVFIAERWTKCQCSLHFVPVEIRLNDCGPDTMGEQSASNRFWLLDEGDACALRGAMRGIARRAFTQSAAAELSLLEAADTKPRKLTKLRFATPPARPSSPVFKVCTLCRRAALCQMHAALSADDGDACMQPVGLLGESLPSLHVSAVQNMELDAHAQYPGEATFVSGRSISSVRQHAMCPLRAFVNSDVKGPTKTVSACATAPGQVHDEYASVTDGAHR
jgi:hypothetical protein